MSKEMNKIKGVKVSDVFDLTKMSFPSSWSDAQVRVGGRAIASYDPNQETITKLTTERDKTISLMSKSWKHEPHGDELIYNHTKALLNSIESKDGVITKKAERIKELEGTLKQTQLALEACYDVVDYPCNGSTKQDKAIKLAVEILAKGD